MDFKDYAAEERKRLVAERDVIEHKLTALDNAIRAYEDSVAPTPAPAPKAAPAAPAKRRRRRRSSRRNEIVRIIGASGSDGIGRAGIILALNVKGNKSAEQSVSNTLSALKKSGEVRHADGKYFGS